MSKENILKFELARHKDEALTKKVDAIAKEAPEKRYELLVAIATEAGFPFTVEEYSNFKIDEQELDMDALDTVSGGSWYNPYDWGGEERDYLTQMCAATVEVNSCCSSNDGCFVWSVRYAHKPYKYFFTCTRGHREVYMANCDSYIECPICHVREDLDGHRL